MIKQGSKMTDKLNDYTNEDVDIPIPLTEI